MRILFALLLVTGLQSYPLDYRISATLNVGKKTVTATETITWTNQTETATSIMPLHLYMNAFSNNESIFLRESGGRHRASRLNLNDSTAFGYCKVLSVTVDGEPATERFHYITDLENAEELNLYHPTELTQLMIRPDRTIGVIQLGRSVEPGESVIVDIAFETRFPRVFARTGYWDSYIFAGQWFPKPAVFEGEKGWNCHFFHLHSEFFADFATFTVTLDVPDTHVVGATGIPVAEERKDGRAIHTFQAEQVHDFAWTAWDHWQVATDTWKGVDLVLLYPPGRENTVIRQFHALKAAMDGYAELCGFDYPYARFTLVDPPMQAAGSGGMEYPMLVTGFYPTPVLPQGIRIPETTIIHEFGHNYFYGILAFNEFEHPWLDEGLNSYADSFATERAYGNAADLPFLKVGAFDNARISNAAYKGPDAPDRPAWGFSPGGYATLTYSKPEIIIRTLENMVGRDTLITIFRTFFDRFKYQHPGPEDFLTVVREVAGETAHDFLDGMVHTNARIDYAVRRARTFRKPAFTGLKNFEAVADKANDEQQTVENEAGEGKEKTWWNLIIVENRGDFDLPVTIEAQLENGETREFQWDGKDGWKRFEFESSSRMTVALIDPDRVYACDVKLENNARVLQSRTVPQRRKISATAAFLVQMVFSYLTLAI